MWACHTREQYDQWALWKFWLFEKLKWAQACRRRKMERSKHIIYRIIDIYIFFLGGGGGGSSLEGKSLEIDVSPRPSSESLFELLFSGFSPDFRHFSDRGEIGRTVGERVKNRTVSDKSDESRAALERSKLQNGFEHSLARRRRAYKLQQSHRGTRVTRWSSRDVHARWPEPTSTQHPCMLGGGGGGAYLPWARKRHSVMCGWRHGA